MDSILLALQSVFSPISLLANILGVALLPLTYGLEPAESLIMLAGMYMGATHGGPSCSMYRDR